MLCVMLSHYTLILRSACLFLTSSRSLISLQSVVSLEKCNYFKIKRNIEKVGFPGAFVFRRVVCYLWEDQQPWSRE